MKKISSKIVPAMLMLAMVAGGAMLWAQDDRDRGDRERGERGDRRQVDREDMRERFRERRAEMSERMREQLGVSVDEWGVIEPMINDVQTLQAEGSTRGRFTGGRGRGGGRGFDGEGFGRGQGRGGDREQSPVREASRDLNEALADDNATEAEIQEKLEALRSAREAHQQQLEEAREELRSVLTPRQEAQLVIAGILE